MKFLKTKVFIVAYFFKRIAQMQHVHTSPVFDNYKITCHCMGKKMETQIAPQLQLAPQHCVNSKLEWSPEGKKSMGP